MADPSCRAIQCPICYTAIEGQKQCFLEPCFHVFCRECLETWIRRCKDDGLGHVECPFCRQSAIALLRDCDSSSFVRVHLGEIGPHGDLPGNLGDAALWMAEPMRARRRVYALDSANIVSACIALVVRQQDPSSLKPDGMYPRCASTSTSVLGVGGVAFRYGHRIRVRAGDQAIVAWVRRELQALLREDNPACVVEVVMRAVRKGLGSSQESLRAHGVECAHFVDTLAAASQPFLGQQARTFGFMLLSFVSFPAHVQLWDQALAKLLRQSSPGPSRSLDSNSAQNSTAFSVAPMTRVMKWNVQHGAIVACSSNSHDIVDTAGKQTGLSDTSQDGSPGTRMGVSEPCVDHAPLAQEVQSGPALDQKCTSPCWPSTSIEIDSDVDTDNDTKSL